VTTPGYWRALRLGVAASVEHAPALGRFAFDSVVDVGANKGQFATFARVCFPQCRIVSFEPLDGPAHIFESLFRNDAKTRLVRTAIGSKRGSLVMQVTAQDDSSSPLVVGKIQRQAFGTTVVGEREVPSGPLLDFVCDDDLGKSNLLKVDTQGFELEVLRGAESLLDRFSVIYCEVSFVELYVGQALASDVITYLFHHQFDLKGVYNIASSRNVGPLQADMLFFRRDQ
jgi:FkbM family methyltransferase